MKKSLLILLASAFVLAFSACKEKPVVSDPPTVFLTQGTIGSNSLSFTITPANATKCTYLYIESTQSQPDIDYILEHGTQADATQESTYTITELLPSTEYIIYAAVSGQGGTAMSEPLSMTTSEAFDGIETNVLIDATYRTDNSKGNGNYTIVIGNAEAGADGDPANVGDIMLVLDMYNVPDSDALNATLPDGEYVPGADFAPFTWNPQFSGVYIRTAEGDEGVETLPMIDGKITVSRTGSEYTIIADMTTMDGTELTARYKGIIMFVQTGSAEYEKFTENQDIDFELSQGRYWGNWDRPHADDFVLEFFTGEFNDDNAQIEGYYLYMPMFMDKLEDQSVEVVPIQEGTYNTSMYASSEHIMSIPLTFEYGQMQEFWGQFYPIGTYLTYVTKSGKKQIGFITDGTVTISRSGTDYSIDFNLVTEEGISIEGTYNGFVNLMNYCDNSSMPERPYSTFDTDMTVNFPQDVALVGAYFGSYLYPDKDSWMMNFISPTVEGEMITLEAFVPKGHGLQFPEGTYTVSREYDEFVIIPGFMNRGGQLFYGWYGDTSAVDSDGYNTKIAPFEGGTMTVTKDGADYRFVFDFIDDKGNKITGEYIGAMQTEDFSDMDAQAIAPRHTLSVK